MQIVKRLVVAYATILIVLLMFVIAVGRMVGPVEFALAVVLALIAAAYYTRKIVRPTTTSR